MLSFDNDQSYCSNNVIIVTSHKNTFPRKWPALISFITVNIILHWDLSRDQGSVTSSSIHTSSRKTVPVPEDLKPTYLMRHNRCTQQTAKAQGNKMTVISARKAITAHQTPGRCHCVFRCHLRGGFYSFTAEGRSDFGIFARHLIHLHGISQEAGVNWQVFVLSQKFCISHIIEIFTSMETQRI